MSRKRPNLTRIRKEIFQRDEGICWGCGQQVAWSQYELGHIVDRHNGGTDTEDNLAVMCHPCNRYKPSHPDRQAAEAWRDRGGVYGSMVNVAESLTVDDVQGISEHDLEEFKFGLAAFFRAFAPTEISGRGR